MSLSTLFIKLFDLELIHIDSIKKHQFSIHLFQYYSKIGRRNCHRQGIYRSSKRAA